MVVSVRLENWACRFPESEHASSPVGRKESAAILCVVAWVSLTSLSALLLTAASNLKRTLIAPWPGCCAGDYNPVRSWKQCVLICVGHMGGAQQLLDYIFIVIATFFILLLHSFHTHPKYTAYHLLLHGAGPVLLHPSGNGEPWRAFEQGCDMELGSGMINLAVGLSLMTRCG